MRINHQLKQILGICVILLIAAKLTACDTPVPANNFESPGPTKSVEGTEDAEVRLQEPEEMPKTSVNSEPENKRFEIPPLPVEEEDFIENLDTAVLERIASEIQSLVAEIGEKEKADPDFVLQGKWNEYFRASEQYNLVLELGLRAVKPAYYIIYKSQQSGLYEYILASAIDEITGYDYAVTESYGWSTSKQFLEMYNEKVKRAMTSFREIMDNAELNEGEKLEQIRALGFFVIAPLLYEIDTSSSKISGESLEACLWDIIENYSGEDVSHDLQRWRSENEQTYRNIIEILE